MSALTNLFSVLVLRLRIAWEGMARALSDRRGHPVGEWRRVEGEGRRRDSTTRGSSACALRPLRAFLPNLVLRGRSSAPIPTPAPRSSRATRTSSRCSTAMRTSRWCTSPRCGRSRAARISSSACRTRALYTRDVSNMRLAMRRDDVADHRRSRSRAASPRPGRASSEPHRRPDRPVPARADGDRRPIISARRWRRTSDLVAWSTLMFWYLFIDLAGDPMLECRAFDAAASCRAVIDAAIADRKATGETQG